MEMAVNWPFEFSLNNNSDVEAAEKERKYKQMELAKGASLYRDRLGLRFERFEGSGTLLVTSVIFHLQIYCVELSSCPGS
jgi:hypothetical protein